MNCKVDGCSNGGTCNENNRCECKGNFSGSFCNFCKGDFIGENCDIDRCNSEHMQFLDCKTTCLTDNNGYSKCSCLCDDENNGVCNEDGTCTCIGDWSGDRCTISGCENNKCNGGTCSINETGEIEFVLYWYK